MPRFESGRFTANTTGILILFVLLATVPADAATQRIIEGPANTTVRVNETVLLRCRVENRVSGLVNGPTRERLDKNKVTTLSYLRRVQFSGPTTALDWAPTGTYRSLLVTRWSAPTTTASSTCRYTTSRRVTREFTAAKFRKQTKTENNSRVRHT